MTPRPSRDTTPARERHPLHRMLAEQGFVVLDGGLATALEARGHALDSALWSARLLIDAPDAIRDVHGAYLESGADCITTASYQATLSGFAVLGVAAAEGQRLLHRSVELAVQSRDAFWSVAANREGRQRPLVAASVGPYGAYLADGSEYDGRYVVGHAAAHPRALDRAGLTAFHHQRLQVLSDAGPDLLALETLPSLAEVELLVDLLGRVRHPGAWVSFTCRDGARLWDGSPVEEAVRACRAEAGVLAVGVNCTAPAHVGSLVRRMRAATDLPILAYPNSGEGYDARAGLWSGQEAGAGWLDELEEWVAAGARLVGGCCRVGPDVIGQLRPRLAALLGE